MSCFNPLGDPRAVPPLEPLRWHTIPQPACGPHGPMETIGHGTRTVWYKCQVCSRFATMTVDDDSDEMPF